MLRGGLPPNKRGTIDAKHRIRRELHPQVRQLWRNDMSEAWTPAEGKNRAPIDVLADEHAKWGFRFAPLVTRRNQLAASIDVLMLRRDGPPHIFGDSGDLDGRVKTLLDGLRMPRQQTELGGATPAADENPLFVRGRQLDL